MDKELSAEQTLDKIFTIMQQLYNEMRLNKEDDSSHLRVFELFAELGKALVSADRASFWFWDKPEHRLVTKVATETDQLVIEDTSGLVGRALAANCPIVTNDPYSHPDFNVAVDKKTGYVTKSILVMPVSNCRGELIGAFQVINKIGNSAGFDEAEDTKRLSIAAFICGMALESDLFLADSQRDKLTALRNRSAFHSDYQTRYRRPFQDPNYSVPISIVICDIDFFKKVNDTYGHNAGDAVLRNISQLLKSKIRDRDRAYRWGGEEFLIILEGAALSDAASVAERIRLAVMNSICRFENEDIRVTMSFGCAEYDRAYSVEENIKIADTRLYRAKKTGRNRVIAGEE